MLLVADVENSVTFTERINGKGKKSVDIDNSPFNKANALVSTGLAVKAPTGNWFASYHFHSHVRLSHAHNSQAQFWAVQGMLDRCTLLIGHNVKYDLQWLWAAGFKYDGEVYDTSLGEYVLARGQKDIRFSLDESAKRRNVTHKMGELVKEYWDAGVGFDSMPISIVTEYGMADVLSCGELYDAQVALYEMAENSGLKKTLKLMNEFCRVLARMEFDGIKIDTVVLDDVEQEFINERDALRDRMQQLCQSRMGDTPINLDSPEQLSRVIYSRILNDKKSWAAHFIKDGLPINRRIKPDMFKKYVANHTTVLQRTKAEQCPACKGVGYVVKTKKDGTPFSKRNKCVVCDTTGFLYKPTGKTAGFMFNAKDADWVSANGFSTSKDELTILSASARSRGMAEAEEFFEGMMRLNAINTYLDSFVSGIRRSTRLDTMLLHCKFNQMATSTGRLSSSQPNMQNMPRGKTFPVKKAIVSRFVGGQIMEADFSQLEFRSAGELSGCAQITQDIADKVDVHSVTAKVLTDAGEPRDRQEAKSRTFKPLYGGTQGSPAEMVYFEAFLKKYSGVARWHKDLQEHAIAFKKIVIPTGREYAFPYCKRNSFGGATQATKIKNYPVQGFATADIVPWAVINLYWLMRKYNCKSVLINTVHDSIVVDCHPDEIELVSRLMYAAMVGVTKHMSDYYGITMKIPLAVEIKVGYNWMDGKEINLDGYSTEM